MDRQSVERYLTARRSRWQCSPLVDSTNTRCRELLAQDAPDGTVVLAGGQTAGRGRRGRSFQSPQGMGIYLSVLWRPAEPEPQLLAVPALGALATCRAIARVSPAQAAIKWPNDLVYRDKKICGMLTELVLDGHGRPGVILGIGINVRQRPEDFSPEVRPIASSLEQETGAPVSRSALAAALMEELDALRPQAFAHPERWAAAYRSACLTIGREVRIITAAQEYTAQAVDVDDAFALVVELPDGSRRTVRSGEASVRGLYGYV